MKPAYFPSKTGRTVVLGLECMLQMALAVKYPTAEPKNTSESQWSLSFTRDRAVKVAIPYAAGGINRLSTYSVAKTVARENAEVLCPEGNDRFESDSPVPGPCQVL